MQEHDSRARRSRYQEIRANSSPERLVAALVACLLLLVACATAEAAQTRAPLRAIRVHAGGHFLETDDGRPFFWLGDTAWQLIHATTREEGSYYLRTRARQGFTVVQAVALAEFDGVSSTSALGQKPFADNDPLKPNEAYFDRVAEIVDEAASLGLYVALLPTWGDKITAPWGTGPRLFRTDNLPVARAYARYLGRKLKGRTNVVWMLGGDRPPLLDGTKPNEWAQTTGAAAGFKVDHDWRPIWREMAAGIAEGMGTTPVCLYHPQGGVSSSLYLHREQWLSINGMQSGHGGGHDYPVWDLVAHDYALSPTKPTLDLEPNYEDHPYNPWPRWDPSTGYFRDHDVRKQTYRSVFAGACGVTYGHHAVWGFVGARNDVINHADRDWVSALHRPGGQQMFFLRQLIESRPFFTRVPDQSLIVGGAGSGGQHLQATRDEAGTYAFVYFPLNDQSATVDLRKLRGKRASASWYDPRTGFSMPAGEFDTAQPREFRSPPFGPDWVLVLDDPAAGYAPVGM
jgi:hypothetical protein